MSLDRSVDFLVIHSQANPCLSSRTEFEVIVHSLDEILDNQNATRMAIKFFDITGREISTARNQIVFILYNDGTVEKKFVSEPF